MGSFASADLERRAQPAYTFGTMTLYGGTWHARRFDRIRPLPPEDSGGGGGMQRKLTRLPAGRWEVTPTAGWKIRVTPATAIVVLIAPNGRERLENWGDGNVRENLNGKHLKDWFSDLRT